jgi:hypothetical protein
MTSTDAEIARNVRREFGKRPVDATRLDVQVTQGRVSLAGIVGQLRDQRDINLKDEMSTIIKQLMRDRLVKEVQDMTRLVQTEKEAEDTNTRGRIRPGR